MSDQHLTLDAQALLTELNQLGEHQRIEGKRASAIDTSVLETVCAFANEPGLDGGWLLLGVDRIETEDAVRYQAVGLRDPDRVLADLASQCKTSFNRQVFIHTRTQAIDGAVVVAVKVDEAVPGDKPIYFVKKGLPKGAFRRVGSVDEVCTDDDLVVLYQGRTVESYDAGVLSDASLEDLDADAIAGYRRDRQMLNPEAEELSWTDEDLLKALRAVVRDGDQWKPTRAGILLFGNKPALRRCFPMMRVDYLRVPGKEWVADPDSRFTATEMRGPLMQVITRAHAAVLADLPRRFRLEEDEVQRSDIPALPAKALREAIVNAVMHRSYRIDQPVLIIRYDNRLEIRNPGHSLKPVELLGDPGSQPRNPHIAAVLHETAFAETKGSGIRTIQRLMREAGLPLPIIDSDRSHERFAITFLMHHLMDEDDWRWLTRFSDCGLSDEEAKALVLVREIGVIDNALYRELNSVDTLGASVHLRRMRDLGLLHQRGKGSATYYAAGTRLTNPGPEPTQTTIDLVTTGGQPVGEPPTQGGEPPTQGGEPPTQGTLTLGQRAKPEEIRAAIMTLCRGRFCTGDTLANQLGRDQKYLTQRYLTPMVKSGELVFRFPEQPAHPQQAYRTATTIGRPGVST